MTSAISKALVPMTNYAAHLPINGPAQMLRNLNSIAIPAIALAAASQVKGAQAWGLSKISCAICLAASLTTAGASAMACVVPCAIAAITTPIPGF